MTYHILCIDDDAEFLLNLKIQLKQNYQVSTSQSLTEGFEILSRDPIDLVLLDVSLRNEDGIVGLKKIKAKFPSVDIVMVSGQKDPQLIVTAIRSGASDYLCKPYHSNELEAVVEKMQNLKGLRDRHEALVADCNVNRLCSKIVGESPIFKNMLAKISCVKGHHANVLIQGESGTGKELIARYIHNLEQEPKRPFIAVNCAAIPDTLIESELFGHERGAFTGASRRKIGKFEMANGGDIFLDEINSLKTELQAKILRVIQEQEIYRLGGTKPIRIKFRVIAATNMCLEDMVKQGSFRMDLYHRLRVLSFKIPSLRDRSDDIPILIDSFLEKYNHGSVNKELSQEVLKAFMTYSWPGNVRELENIIHSLIIMSPDKIIQKSELPSWLYEAPITQMVTTKSVTSVEPNEIVTLKDFVQTAEKQYIVSVMKMKNGDKSRTARLLGISRSSLYDKISRLH